MIATITRVKLYPTPGKNYRLAWKWLYDVNGLSTDLCGFDRLTEAKRMAKRYGATVIKLAWEAT